MWNDKTTVISRTAIVSFVRTEIQSRHASSAARFSGPHVSRDARTVSKKLQRERKREKKKKNHRASGRECRTSSLTPRCGSSFSDWRWRRSIGCGKHGSRLRCGRRRKGEEQREVLLPLPRYPRLPLHPPILQVSESLHPPLPFIKIKKKERKRRSKRGRDLPAIVR